MIFSIEVAPYLICPKKRSCYPLLLEVSSPPSIEPVLAEDGADHFLQNLNQQFKPEKPIGIVPPSSPWKPEPVLAETPDFQPIVASEDHWIINKPEPEPVVAESPVLEPIVASEAELAQNFLGCKLI